MILKTCREDVYAEAVKNAAMQRFGVAEYAITCILSYILSNKNYKEK